MTQEAEMEATPGDNAGQTGLAGGGWMMVLVGAVIVGVAFFFDVGMGTGTDLESLYQVPSRVANIDKIAIRHMILASGLALFVSGWVLVGADHIASAVRRGRTP